MMTVGCSLVCAVLNAVSMTASLLGRHDGLHVGGNIGERELEVRLLLVEGAERVESLLADDRDHGLVIHLRVVETVQHVERTRARGGNAHPDFAGELGVGRGHERADLFVGRTDVFEALPVALCSSHCAVKFSDSVTGKTEYSRHSPLPDSLDDEVTHGCHCPPHPSPSTLRGSAGRVRGLHSASCMRKVRAVNPSRRNRGLRTVRKHEIPPRLSGD
jgi:hypothetical protein